jgi:hypothetical protein
MSSSASGGSPLTLSRYAGTQTLTLSGRAQEPIDDCSLADDGSLAFTLEHDYTASFRSPPDRTRIRTTSLFSVQCTVVRRPTPHSTAPSPETRWMSGRRTAVSAVRCVRCKEVKLS